MNDKKKIKSMFRLMATVFLFLSLFLQPLAAGKGRIVFVETDVDLRADGSAVVAYTVQWQVISGELHGFYFQGNDRLRVDKISSDSYAVDSMENKYELEIIPMSGGKWDILLANGQGVYRETVPCALGRSQ